MRKQQKKYEPRFRFSFSPRTVVGMGAPPRFGTRVKNFGSIDSSEGLQAMHSGEISTNSARKIRNAVDWLLASAKTKTLYSKKNKRFYNWKTNFLTLTLPTQGNKTDIEVKEILHSFLILAKHNYGLHSYIWKAEPQQRGAIHFHITTDVFMWKNSVQFEWNRLLRKKGLLNNHENPPTIKIHSTYRVKNMAGYLTKYFVKPQYSESVPPKEKSDFFKSNRGYIYTREEFINNTPHSYIRPICGRLWGCNQELSRARNFSFIVDSDEMRAMNDNLRNESSKEKTETYCNMFFLREPEKFYAGDGIIQDEYRKNIELIRGKKWKKQLTLHDAEGLPITDKTILKKFARKKIEQIKLEL